MILVGEIRDQETADIALAGGADRPSAAQHAAHQRRAGHHHAAVRSRHSAVSRCVIAHRHRRAAARPAAVPGVRCIRSSRAPSRSRSMAGDRGCPPMGSGWPGKGCDECAGSGLEGPNRDSRSAVDQRRGARTDFEPGARARYPKGRAASRHADAARRRHRQGRTGTDDARGSASCRGRGR